MTATAEQRRPLTPEEAETALAAVLDYLWADEAAGYESRTQWGDGAAGHIFPKVRALRDWLRQPRADRFGTGPGDGRYSGWGNYETWAVHLWLTNEEPTYRYWTEEARRHQAEAPGSKWVREGVWPADKAARFLLADQLRDEVEGGAPLTPGSLYTDLLAAALTEVD